MSRVKKPTIAIKKIIFSIWKKSKKLAKNFFLKINFSEILVKTFRIVLLIFAAILSYKGQGLLSNGNLLPGAVYFFAASFLGTISLLGLFKNFFPVIITEKKSLRELFDHYNEKRFYLFSSFVFISISLFLFYKQISPNIAWFLYFLSILSLIIFASSNFLLKYSLKNKLKNHLGKNFWEKLFVLLITLIGFVLRSVNLSEYPSGLWFDESNNGLAALKIIDNPDYRPIFIGSGHEQPGMHFMLLAIFIKAFGQTIFALRFPSAIIGTLTIPILYLFVKQILKNRTAAATAALLLTFSYWHINFSRIAFNSIFSVFFDLLALLFLFKGLENRKIKHFILAGISLGIGLNMYHSSRVFLLFFLVTCLLSVIINKQKIQQVFLLFFFVFSLLVTTAPLALFAITNQSTFFKHTAELNLFKILPKEEIQPTLLSNTQKHLLMFNYQADAIARHNTPGKPILEYFTSMAFVLGLGIALLNFFRFNFLTLFLGFFILLAGGIFSKPIDLPTSLRTIDSMIFVFTLASIPFTLLKNFLDYLLKFFKPLKYLTAVLLFVLLMFIGHKNIQQYLHHMNLGGVWSEFNGPHTEIAKEINKLDLNKTEIFFTEIYVNQPTLFYLAPKLISHNPYKDSLLPFTDSSKNYFVCLNQNQKSLMLETFYPNASLIKIHPQNNPSAVTAKCFYITKTSVKTTKGVSVNLYNNSNFSGTPITSTQPSLSLSNLASSPTNKTFSVSQKTIFKNEKAGQSSFLLKTNGTTAFFINSEKFLEGSSEKSIFLPAGNILFELKSVYPSAVKPNTTLLINRDNKTFNEINPNLLFVSPPINNNGLLAKYYADDKWAGVPLLTSIEANIDFYFHIHPVPQPWSTTWEGQIEIPETKKYKFFIAAIDKAWVFIDNKLIITNEKPNTFPSISEDIHLTAGKHDIFVAYISKSGYPQIRLSWNASGGNEVIPFTAFYPKEIGFNKSLLK